MTSPHYPEVNPNPDFPAIEEKILAFWEKEKIFEKSVAARPATKEGHSNEFIFYDGPPFANGLPHYGHLLTGFVKDVIARYQTMRGKRVERRFGWDCHGLPAEMGTEKELGISGRQAIIKYGIGKFNEHCRTSVMKYTKEWEYYVNRQARWVDFKNDYKTMDINFMESVLWAFKQLYDKGLIFEAYRVMPYSWAAETPLSNFETKLDNSYREREDKAITVAFELNTPPHGAPKADKYYVLAWTTTPWTLPSNLALAVNKEAEYVYICHSREGGNPVCYILGANAAGRYAKELGLEEGKKLDSRLRGNDMIGLSYHPLFPYFASHKHAFRILDGSNFVTDADGTGIVHMAPGFGEDDQKVCEANGIEIVVPVDGRGKYTDEIFDIAFPSLLPSGEGGAQRRMRDDPQAPNTRIAPHPGPLPEGEGVLRLCGLNVIAEPGGSKFGLANDRIIDYLKRTGQLIKQETIKHNYPHCWRTDTPLIYRAMPSWYVEVTKFRERAVEINRRIDWIPEHVRDGQMGHMLSTAPDWSISRNRFWGTPIPVWRSKSGKIKVFGSIAELEKASGQKITDLHRPTIDDIVIRDDGEEYRRVEDVFDCWFESGSMPFAQVHYPFANKDWFERHFPADFITEYVGQTRGWFNTLIMLATALFDKEPFKHCICHGVVLDSETGLKYSKRLKNYKDPKEVMDKFGADALRWLMLSSPVMRGQDLMVDPEGKFIRDVVRLAIKPIWNAYNFFCLYANADGVKANFSTDSQDVMDRYILAKCKQAVDAIQKSFDSYDTPGACEAVMQFFEALNNWYIRRNKERFWKSEHDADKQAAYDTLYTVLTTMCRAAAPLLPLTLEEIYRGLIPSPSGRRWRKAPDEGLSTNQNPKVDIEHLMKARDLRAHSTDAEQRMWYYLRDRRMAEAKFKRQQPIGQYIVDFLCHDAKLVVEIDGSQHAEQQKDYDEKRDTFLKAQGYMVMRFWNNDVLQNTESVLQAIYDYLSAQSVASPSSGASRHLLPAGEGNVAPISVHLTDWPDVSAFPEDEALLHIMEMTRDTCNAALAIRNKLNIRVRQPLKELRLVGANASNIVNFGKNIIADEINVKEVIAADEYHQYAALKLSLENKEIAKRLPEKMKQIIPASKKGEWELTEQGVEICDEILKAGEYSFEFEPNAEYKNRAQALSTGLTLVILDTTVTPELEAEGIARDMVRMIQQARKDANLNVSDRIRLYIDTSEVINKAMNTHKDYIMEQTLAVELSNRKPEKPAFTAENTLDDQKVVVILERA